MLAPGEQGLYSRSFRPNLILFWLRTTMLVTNKRIAVKSPNTILGVIPLGYEERSMPLGSVAGVTANLRVRLGRGGGHQHKGLRAAGAGEDQRELHPVVLIV